ncbi:cupin domain-containing protein [Nocardia panacis]|uniref:Cupin domain-containing protein n=1 Tax=Nocardia panacis TaxID=2340916 RepID=A0A3A4KBI5_9NOCA|nr:cupin domain-containing protein [Nocardia panacis]RJO70820.1 cupin domain-containing protein [Nocardia panacis]
MTVHDEIRTQTGAATPQATVSAPGSGLRVASGGMVYRYLATGAETNNKYSLFEATLRPGEGAPFHIHSREEEAFLVQEGEVVFFTDTQRIPASAGTFLNASVGVVRGFRNDTDRPARMLILVAPSGLEKMFIEDGVILTGPDDEAPAGGADCPIIAGQYGIEVVPTPLPSA